MTGAGKHMSTKMIVSHMTLYFLCKTVCTIPQRKTYPDTMPLPLTNGNTMFSEVHCSSTF